MLTSRFEEALIYAFRLHNQQRRKGNGVPYFSHLMGVAALVLEDGGDEDQAIAALLHDAAEDQGGLSTLDEIRQRWGDGVAEIVAACSDTFETPKPPWQQRKEQYLAHLPSVSAAIRRVSLADKVYNARTIIADLQFSGPGVWARFKGDKDGTLWYYRQLAQIFRQTGDDFLTRELTRLVEEMECLAAGEFCMIEIIKARKLQMTDWALLAVVIVSLFSTLTLTRLDPLVTAIFILAVIAYGVMGVYGVEFCEEPPRQSAWNLVYFLIQVGIGVWVFYISDGVAWLILTPIASQAVYSFSRRGLLLALGVIYAASMGVLLLLTDNPATIGSSGLALAAALMFVAIFTQIAVNEERARTEVERLNTQLGEANLKLRQYAAKAEELATLQERNRLAREIHDGLGHYLTALNIQIKAAQAVMAQKPDCLQDAAPALDALAKAQTLAQDALADVRRSVAALRGDDLLNRPLAEAIGVLVEETRSGGLVVEWRVSGSVRGLPTQAAFTLYRAAQEALTNVRKHALASRVDVTLEYLPAAVRLVVADNGIGARIGDGAKIGDSAQNISTGFGVLGMQERVALLGGKVETDTAPQAGFRLTVEVPA